MKSIAILLMVVAVCYGYEDMCKGDFLESVIGKCLAKYGGDKGHIADLLMLTKSSNEDGKCFRACILQSCNYFDEVDKMHDDVPTRVAHLLNGGDENKVPTIKAIGNKCLSELNYQGSVCDTAESWSTCLGRECNLQLGSCLVQ